MIVQIDVLLDSYSLAPRKFGLPPPPVFSGEVPWCYRQGRGFGGGRGGGGDVKLCVLCTLRVARDTWSCLCLLVIVLVFSVPRISQTHRR